MTLTSDNPTLRHCGLTAERVREMLPYFPSPEPTRTTTPYVLRNKAIVRTDEEIQHALGMFEGGATFRQVRKATGMSMAKLKKIKESLPCSPTKTSSTPRASDKLP